MSILTTFDYIPKLILGKTSNHAYNTINLVIRLIAFYIYFKANIELDILQIILAYIFPIVYILYAISEYKYEYILGLFGIGTGSGGLPGEACIERRGAMSGAKKSGDRESIPEDIRACESVELGTTESKNKCLNVKSVGNSDLGSEYPAGINACLYIDSKEDNVHSDIYFDCSTRIRSGECEEIVDNTNRKLCEWLPIDEMSCDLTLSRINKDSNELMNRDRCPRNCQWFGDATDLRVEEGGGGFCDWSPPGEGKCMGPYSDPKRSICRARTTSEECRGDDDLADGCRWISHTPNSDGGITNRRNQEDRSNTPLRDQPDGICVTK